MKRTFNTWITLLLLVTGSSLAIGQSNPSKLFGPYLTGKAPKIIKDLGEEVKNGVRLRKVVFHSYSYKEGNERKNAEIFAAIAKPEKAGVYPGLLVLHGGGGHAEIEKAKKWAAQGYIVLVLDEPGVAHPDKIPMSHGPWEKYKYGENRFVVKPEISSSTLFSAVLASVQGLYLLHAQPDVKTNKIGVVGISWGGYLTTFVSGLANSMVAASFSVYGSGYYDYGSTFQKNLNDMKFRNRNKWLKTLDAGRVAKHIETPFFIAAAANDNWFYPPAVAKTLQGIKGTTNHLYAPNNSHKIELPGGTHGKEADEPGWLSMERVYFDYYLKGKGNPLPHINNIEMTRVNNDLVKVRFKVTGKGPYEDAHVCYGTKGADWPKKVWETTPAIAVKNGWLEAEIPLGESKKELICFASISDSRPVTVSSEIITLE